MKPDKGQALRRQSEVQGREHDAGCLAEQTDGGHFAHALEPLAVAASWPSAHTVVKEGKNNTQKKKRSVSSGRASLNGLVNLHSDGLYVTLGLGGSSELRPRESRRSLVYHTRLEAAAQRCKCLRSLQKIKNNNKKMARTH